MFYFRVIKHLVRHIILYYIILYIFTNIFAGKTLQKRFLREHFQTIYKLLKSNLKSVREIKMNTPHLFTQQRQTLSIRTMHE